MKSTSGLRPSFYKKHPAPVSGVVFSSLGKKRKRQTHRACKTCFQDLPLNLFMASDSPVCRSCICKQVAQKHDPSSYTRICTRCFLVKDTCRFPGDRQVCFRCNKIIDQELEKLRTPGPDNAEQDPYEIRELRLQYRLFRLMS